MMQVCELPHFYVLEKDYHAMSHSLPWKPWATGKKGGTPPVAWSYQNLPLWTNPPKKPSEWQKNPHMVRKNPPVQKEVVLIYQPKTSDYLLLLHLTLPLQFYHYRFNIPSPPVTIGPLGRAILHAPPNNGRIPHTWASVKSLPLVEL